MPRAAEIYPLFLDLTRIRVTVFGAGPVGLRKIKGLPRGVRVTLIAPDAPRLRGVRVLRRKGRLSDADGADLIFTATSDKAFNDRAAKRALAKGRLVCAAHDAGKGNAQVPALLKAGPFRIAISSGGRGPAASKFLKAWLEKRLTKAVLRLMSKRLRP